MRRFILCVLAIVMILSFAACAKLLSPIRRRKDNPVGLTEEKHVGRHVADGLAMRRVFEAPLFRVSNG